MNLDIHFAFQVQGSVVFAVNNPEEGALKIKQSQQYPK